MPTADTDRSAGAAGRPAAAATRPPAAQRRSQGAVLQWQFSLENPGFWTHAGADAARHAVCAVQSAILYLGVRLQDAAAVQRGERRGEGGAAPRALHSSHARGER